MPPPRRSPHRTSLGTLAPLYKPPGDGGAMIKPVELSPAYPIHTRRLRLRPLTTSDTDDLLAYRSLEEVCRYVPFLPMTRASVAEKLATDWSRQQITSEGEALTLGVELAEVGTVIGDVMLYFVSAVHRRGDVGWVLHPAHSGHGYATEAARAVLHLAFDGLGLHRVVARVDARNTPSLRLAERLGMRQEAHLIQNEWFKGGWGDEIDFGMVEEEWARLAESQR